MQKQMESGNSTSMLSIQALTPADIPTILALIRELADFEQMTARITATTEKLHETLFGHRKYAEGFLGILAGRAVAYTIFHHTYSTFAAAPGLYIEDIYVQEAFRGRGFGRQIMRHLAEVALERSCRSMSWSVLGWNQQAIDFYLGLGAYKYSEWDSYKLDEERLKLLAGNR